ncbi:serine hydrolase domain-containing protein [Kribbella solani]|uniref:serine hydrolase domain-containing protein n=1 Tax=Kribbella solani TaxID=236067 RepID=UPI0029B9FD66|nr:serine hydrolase domain-containing protein [Kribbella solani]MDX2969466.1 serine hydrolase [Kribbella solani]
MTDKYGKDLVRALIAAINSGDPAELTAFLTVAWQGDLPSPPTPARPESSADPATAAVNLLAMAKSTGELMIMSIDADGTNRIRCLLFAPLIRHWYELTVGIGDDSTVNAFDLEAASAPDWLPAEGNLDSRITQATSYLQELWDADLFSGVVRLTQADDVLYESAYGWADRETERPNLSGTPFNVGSMNKMMTSVCIGRLAEQNLLDLDDTVATHLPAFRPDLTSRITIRQVLHHTSGLGDFFNDRFFAGARETLETVDDHLALIHDDPLLFEPGSRFQYSNGGFVVLGAIIEAKTGRSYFDYVREHVFDVARMTASRFPSADELTDEAIGYTNYTAAGAVVGPRVPHLDTLPRRGAPAGGGYCSAVDLTRFGDALRNDKLVGAKVKATLLDSTDGISRIGGALYTLGFQVHTEHDVVSYGHGGGGPGISSFLDVFPDQNRSLVALSNYDSGARNIRAELRRIFWPAD